MTQLRVQRPARLTLDERHWFAVLAAGLVVLQVYLPLYGRFEVTLWQLLLALSLPAALVLGLPPPDAFRRPPSAGLLLLFLGSVALAPTGAGGEPAVRTAVFLGITIAAYIIGYKVGVGGRGPHLVRAFVYFGLPVALLNVVFFFLPAMELAFLRSPAARLFVEPNTLETLFDPRLGNNVLAPLKAGTLFVNTNVASIFFGFGVCAGIYRFGRRPGPGRALAAGLFVAAFLATGSRAGLAASVGAGAAVLLVSAWRLGARRTLRIGGLAVLVGAVVLILPMSRRPLMRIASVATAGDPRLLIWAHGAQLIAQHPIAGVGFGGWGESFPAYARAVGLDPSLPPHNAYVIAWLWLGLAGLATMAVIFGGTFLSFARLTAREWLLDLGLLGIGLTTWFGIQLFFTNFALLEPRVGGAFFLLIGAIYGMAQYRRLQSAKASSRIQEHLSAALGSLAVQQPGDAREV